MEQDLVLPSSLATVSVVESQGAPCSKVPTKETYIGLDLALNRPAGSRSGP
jgi:hypothetical protein